MKIAAIRTYQVDLPLKEGRYSLVRRQVRGGLRLHHRRDPDRRRPLRRGRDAARSAPSTSPPTPKACARASRSSSPAPDRPRPPRPHGAQPPHGPRAPRPPLRQDRHRHGLLGHPRAGRRPAGRHPAGRPPRRRASRSTARSAKAPPRRWPRTSPATAPRATRSSSSRSAATPTTTSPASTPVAGILQPGDVLVADANTGWTIRRRAPRGERRPRRRRLHRAALQDLRGMPRRPPRASRCPSSSTRTSTALDAFVPRHADGAMDVDQPQDLQGRRPDQGPPHPRPLRRARLSR